MINNAMGRIKVILPVFLVFLIITSLSSCFGSKPVAYFNGVVDTTKVSNIQMPDPTIQRGDMLSITIYSDNPEATSIFNQAGGAAAAPGNPAGVSKTVNMGAAAVTGGSGYLVDSRGFIKLHAIGLLQVEGLTKDQLSQLIVDSLNKLGVLNNPYVVIRFNNFKISVLGEVKSPGVFSLPGEKASILEALGLAGDVTDYGLKDRVLLIREDKGNRTYHRLNLLDANVFASPYFYVKQNDVLVVEADNRKPTALDQQTLQILLLSSTLITTAAVLISLFK